MANSPKLSLRFHQAHGTRDASRRSNLQSIDLRSSHRGVARNVAATRTAPKTPDPRSTTRLPHTDTSCERRILACVLQGCQQTRVLATTNPVCAELVTANVVLLHPGQCLEQTGNDSESTAADHDEGIKAKNPATSQIRLRFGQQERSGSLSRKVEWSAIQALLCIRLAYGEERLQPHSIALISF